jgi:hypothetical protein
MPGRETGCSPAAAGLLGPTRLRERLYELAANGRPPVADLDQVGFSATGAHRVSRRSPIEQPVSVAMKFARP